MEQLMNYVVNPVKSLLEKLPKVTPYQISERTEERIRDIVYGNCIGDAIGLLTEFMNKIECKRTYGEKIEGGLRYEHKIKDNHRKRWANGDWTDDSDQMICIMKSLWEKHKVDQVDLAEKFFNWANYGFKELGDKGGLGIGRTTFYVLNDSDFLQNPSKSAKKVWSENRKNAAPNGGVMRTSILGIFEFNDRDKVVKNAIEACRVTHADPRCLASCVTVCYIISSMLQDIQENNEKEDFSDDEIEKLIKDAYEFTANLIFVQQKNEYELEEDQLNKMKEDYEKHCFFGKDGLVELRLDDSVEIGYTLKCMGAGLWALQQEDPGKALTELIMQGGDADTNGAVAGALLACRYGLSKFPPEWKDELAEKPREFLDKNLNK